MKKIPLVYVAGPYTAPTRYAMERHVQAAESIGYEVARLGAMPVIPHTNTRPHFCDLQDESWWYAATLALLRVCDAVILAPGWSQSVGVKGEILAAEELGMPVFKTIMDLGEWLFEHRSEVPE